MAKGAIAKDALMKRITTALADAYVGVDDSGKKFYFWSPENGEQLQIAITMTYAKVPLEGSAASGDLNFEDNTTGVVVPTKVKAMEADEAAALARLKAELGL